MAEKQVEIQFNREYTVQDAEGKQYKEGEKLKCSEASAQHFINRDAAELVKATSKSKGD